MCVGGASKIYLWTDDGSKYELNAKKYLNSFTAWNTWWVGHWMKVMGFDAATCKHELVISKVRGYFLEHGRIPSYRQVLRLIDLKTDELFALFNSDPEKYIPLVAGLPGPLSD